AFLDAKDTFFMVPLQEEDKSQFAFLWEGPQYTFNHLPQGDQRSPTIAHNALAELLQQIEILEGLQIYQHNDDVFIEGEEESPVRTTAQDIWNKFHDKGIEVPFAKCQGPCKEVKFWRSWLSVPTTKKKLQKITVTLRYWRNHVPGCSTIARTLYALMRKKQTWEWLDIHKQALQTSTEKLKAYQSLGPVHPSDP
ncbi:TF26 protein, partial [Furnarius figulus]|nr:TF26 protein [Furnarius figulus]